MIAVSLPFVAAAQQYPVFEQSLPVASLNREDLFNKSAYGKAILNHLNQKKKRLADENTELFNNLESEERELTSLRKTISSTDFEPLAKAFDTKANKIRAQQRQKLAELNSDLGKARFAFFRRSESVIRALMQERGIIYVLNEQAILVSNGKGDITRDVIDRLDRLFAEGELPIEDN